jgi:hypothetical protein
MQKHTRFDASLVKVIPLGTDEDNLAYWLTRTPAERLAAVQALRFPDGSVRPAFQRVCRIVKLKEC